MHCVESVPQSSLNNDNLFLYNFIVFLSSLNVQSLSVFFFFFFPLGWMEGKGERAFSRIFEKGGVLIKKTPNYSHVGTSFPSNKTRVC